MTPSQLETVRLVVDAMANPGVKPADILGGAAREPRLRSRVAHEALRSFSDKFPVLRRAATVAMLVHYPRGLTGSAGSGGDTYGLPLTRHAFAPFVEPRRDWSPSTIDSCLARRVGARGDWNYTDARGEAEAEAIERMADYCDAPVPMQPHVKLGLEVSCAAVRGLTVPARNSGHYQKQNAIKGMERARTFGQSKREIVTREDKARRALSRANRRLDVLQAQAALAGVDKTALAAIALVRSMLVGTAA
jgi:hypothetical protein